MAEIKLREYYPSDLYCLYRICLMTGADGVDATGTIDDEILGHFFAAPYAVTEPDLITVLTADGEPSGYILGTADSRAFESASMARWFNGLRERYALPPESDTGREAMMIRAIHRGYQAPPCADEYPAHLHIDILPVGQGAGYGPRMIERFLDELKARKCPGIHLGVSRANKRAMGFYPKRGFQPINESATSVTFGMKLD